MSRIALSLVLVTGLVAAAQAYSPNTLEHKVVAGGQERSYLLHVPQNFPADREGFLVAYPAGYRKGWNDGCGTGEIAAQRDHIDDLAFVTSLIDDVSKNHAVDPKRIYSTGISNGAMFSHWLAATFQPEQPVSVLVLSGTADPLVPYGGEDAPPFVVDVANKEPFDGCRVKKLVYSAGHNRTEVMVLRLEGAGHAWPGGSQYLSKRMVGSVCRDIDGTEVIWEFFKKHPKP